MKTLLRTLLMASTLMAAMAAFALELGDAKTRGLVGEQTSGYLAAVGMSTPEIAALVADINKKRKAAYEEIAKRNGTELNAVEQLAGQKAIEKTPAGQFVRSTSGDWVLVK